MLEQIAGVITPVFVIAAIGYVWIKKDLPFDNATVSTLVMMIGSPCLIYSSLTRNTPDTEVLMQIFGAAVFAITGAVLLAYPILKALNWRVTTFLPSLIHPNTGNMGLPLVLLAFGEEGLALGMAFFFVNSVSQFTLGMAISSGTFHPSQLLRQPVIWAVVVVMAVIFGGLELPQWINDTTSILGGLTIPAMLLMLGTSLARLNISAIKQTLTASVMRFILGAVVATVAIYLFNLEGMNAGVVFLQCMMPTAVFNYVFAERYNREPDKVAAVVLQSTLLSVITLPLVVGYALTF